MSCLLVLHPIGYLFSFSYIHLVDFVLVVTMIAHILGDQIGKRGFYCVCLVVCKPSSFFGGVFCFFLIPSHHLVVFCRVKDIVLIVVFVFQGDLHYWLKHHWWWCQGSTNQNQEFGQVGSFKNAKLLTVQFSSIL